MGGPPLILLTTLPKSSFTLQPSTPPAAPSRKQSAPDDGGRAVGQAKTDGAAVESPYKRKRLEEEGLVLLEGAPDGMEDMDVIEIG